MKHKIYAVLFIFLTNSLVAQETLLEKANAYFDISDYANAKALYVEILKDDENIWFGEIDYRYAYSCEMLEGLTPDVLNLYAVAGWHSDDNASYMDDVKNKLENNSIDTSSLTLGDTYAIIKKSIKANTKPVSPLKTITNSLRSLKLFGLILLLIVSVIMYVLAYSFSKKTNCIIIWSWWDLILVAVSGLIFVYYLFDTNNKIQNDTFVNILYFIVILAAFAMSIISNLKYSGVKWPLFAIISILTKIVLLFVIPIVLALLIIGYVYVKGDKRYKDGTKNNVRTRNMAIWTIVYTFLIVNLLKTGKETKEVKNAN
jgi:tetratricopeptide (TPR) repeat protein